MRERALVQSIAGRTTQRDERSAMVPLIGSPDELIDTPKALL